MHVFASTVCMQTNGFASFPHSLFLCCTAFALEVLHADLCVDPATLATLTRGRNHDVIFPVTVVMTGN